MSNLVKFVWVVALVAAAQTFEYSTLVLADTMPPVQTQAEIDYDCFADQAITDISEIAYVCDVSRETLIDWMADE